MIESGLDSRRVKTLLPVLAGITLLRVGEICRLAMAEYGQLTAGAVSKIKRQLVSPIGVLSVDTYQSFYLPNAELVEYAGKEKWFFLNGDDYRLMPRGLLLYGDNGTGKSQAAKFLANSWGVPLYLMELSSIVNKYVGESERNMSSMLAQIDAEAPCILLMDEIEKIFGAKGDSGVTGRLLRSEERRVGRECRSRCSLYH